ncbi:hypothetical protein C7U65_10390 [Bradyrhizobium sp. WBAH23]|nr:hypothetical protein [Bradyrhizobium sp. WBAH30]MDD1556030.1 hypothetical protein [Bradyrhizobium sp. WBAH23]MDD1588338.1 hypothetical protein [Bradyrhizobium sp. WBAH42]
MGQVRPRGLPRSEGGCGLQRGVSFRAIKPNAGAGNRPGVFSFGHCERSEAIQNPSAETVWIASLRSQ